MSFLTRIAIFVLVGSTAYVALAIVFLLYCLIGGHNLIEMLYGGTATVVLAFEAALVAAWLASYPSYRRH